MSVGSSIGNLYNQTSPLIYDIIKHIHVVNTSSATITLTLYVGKSMASTAGTEFISSLVIPAHSPYDWYGNLRMECVDFLTGVCSAAPAISIVGEGKQYISEFVLPLWSIGASQ